MKRQSINHAAVSAAAEYCEQVVKRLGASHEAAAHAEWNRDRFWLWVMDRVVEHVEGEQFWLECGRRNFARAQQKPAVRAAATKVRTLQRQIEVDSLPSFQAREKLLQDLGEAANQLLE